MYVCTDTRMYKHICITETKVLFHVMSSNIVFSVVVPPHLIDFMGPHVEQGLQFEKYCFLWMDFSQIFSWQASCYSRLISKGTSERPFWLTKPSFFPVPSPTRKALNSWDDLFCIFSCFILPRLTSCLSPLKYKLNSQHLEQWLALSRHSLNFCWARFYCVRE